MGCVCVCGRGGDRGFDGFVLRKINYGANL